MFQLCYYVSLTLGSHCFSSFQFRSVAQSCRTLCNPMNRSTPGLPVHHQLPQFTQTHAHRVSDAIQPSHPLSSPSPPAPNPSQHQGPFQWVNSLERCVWGGQSIGVSPSASVLPMNTQDWSPLGYLTYMQSHRLVFLICQMGAGKRVSGSVQLHVFLGLMLKDSRVCTCMIS